MISLSESLGFLEIGLQYVPCGLHIYVDNKGNVNLCSYFYSILNILTFIH
jgi:hypothetical protein